MAWLYKQRGSENWWIGYRLNGKQHLRSTGTVDKAEAQKELAKLNLLDQAHKAGSLTEEFFRIISNHRSSNDAIKPYTALWLKECRDLAGPTLERYQNVIEGFCNYLKADDAAPLLRDIRPETVGAFLREKRAETSTATAKLCRRILSGFFNYAVDNRVLQINPVPSAKSLKLTKDSDRVRRAFTLKELKTLFDKAPNDFWRWMVLAGFYMGQRMGDLICLPWGAVDFEQNQIRMVASKTGRAMTIPLRAELRTFLLKLRKNADEPKPADPIWPEQCKRYEEQGAGGFSNEFYDEVLLPAGLVAKRTHHAKKKKDGEHVASTRQTSPVSFHCLRHTFVSLLKISGGSQAVAKELAGHSSDAVSDLYTHVPEDALNKAIKRLPEVTK
jgi:integrase